MKVTSCTTQEDFVDPFPQDLESLFLEEHIVFTEFAIEDTRALVEDMSRQLSCLGIGIQGSDQGSQAEAPGSVEDSVLVENTSMSVEGKGYAGVITNQFGTVITVRDTIAVHELGGRDFGSPTKTICRLDNLGAKYLQTESRQTSSISIPRSIRQPYYDSGGGYTGHFCQVQKFNEGIYERIGQNIRSVQCMQRPEDPGRLLSLNHKAA